MMSAATQNAVWQLTGRDPSESCFHGPRGVGGPLSHGQRHDEFDCIHPNQHLDWLGGDSGEIQVRQMGPFRLFLGPVHRRTGDVDYRCGANPSYLLLHVVISRLDSQVDSL